MHVALSAAGDLRRRVRAMAIPIRGSGTNVLVEPGDGAAPGEVGRSLIVAVRRGIAIEAVNRVGIDIAFVGNINGGQRLVVSRPRGCEARVQLTVMDQNRRLD